MDSLGRHTAIEAIKQVKARNWRGVADGWKLLTTQITTLCVEVA